jgi:GR25 family glycosyltransferase involved in LPS biosynthesis
MCRWPKEWLLKAQTEDICFLEDPRQINAWWCHETFCRELAVTEVEGQALQIVAGILAFRAGTQKTLALFSEAWRLAQKRAVITGEKWLGPRAATASEKQRGHRHDQSILSILSLRQGLARFPLDKVYGDKSLRHTYQTGRSIYCHRGGFQVNVPFTKGIDDCYIINLDRRTDRMERLYAQTPELKERATRLSAIEGKKLQLTPALARLFRPHDFMWKKAIMGCALSHLSLWWKLVNEHQDINTFLILEDDVKLKPEWEVRWKAAEPHLPEDWDIVYLGGILPPNRAAFEMSKERVNAHFSRVAENNIFGQTPPNRYFHWCAYAYVLSRRGAQKVLEILAAHDGYWTSADHMLCNPIHHIKMYFLDPLVAGCYQDDDPVYANSAFNDFNRVDSFDSDLWNNDERFSKEEVERRLVETADDQIDVALALKEAVSPAPAPAPAKAQPNVNPLLSQPPSNFKHRLLCLEGMNLDFSKLHEKEWLYELLGKPSLLAIESIREDAPPPQKGETPILIVMRPWTDKYSALLQRWSAAEESACFVLHLSDEYGTDDIRFYDATACKKVVRMYDRADLTEGQRAKCLIIPLGYHWTLRGGGCPMPLERTPRLPFRNTRWSFFGTNWNDRHTKLAPLEEIEPYRCILLEGWNSANMVGYEEYIGTMLDTVFVPCPGGQNAETYRFYEALECGCVPIVVREPGDELFVKYITSNMPILPVNSWTEAALLMKQLYNDKNLLENYRANLLNGWRVWKGGLVAQVRTALDL